MTEPTDEMTLEEARQYAAARLHSWRHNDPARIPKELRCIRTLLRTADTRADDVAKANLELAARTFRRYERLHRDKGTPEGNSKADSNAELADQMEWAASRVGDDVVGERLYPAALKRLAEYAEDIAGLQDVVGELREALERHDAKVATCPIQRRSQSVCPKCKATSSDTCGVITGAEYAFVQDARAALSRAALAEQEQKPAMTIREGAAQRMKP